MSDFTPAEALDYICFDNIWNNRAIEQLQDQGWSITYATPEFLLLDPEGNIHNLRVEFVPGSLTEEEKATMIEEQEWDES